MIGSCWEPRVILSIRGHNPRIERIRFSARPPFAAAARHIPGCLLRKGGDVPGKEVSSAKWLAYFFALRFEAGSFAGRGQVGTRALFGNF
ncbi:hypothetical protein E4V51_07680 [Paenibacillus sp. 28ISP30-2]|nr:hypothetical protein [Paenibacillus sp. 28ISP30-2]